MNRARKHHMAGASSRIWPRICPRIWAVTWSALALVATGGCKEKAPASAPPADNAATGATAKPPETSTDAYSTKPSAPALLPKPFFYRATKGTSTMYLLGTMHMGIELAQLPPSVWEAFDASSTLAVEANISDPSLVKLMLRTDGKTLQDDLGDRYAKFVELVGKATAASSAKFKPSMAAAQLQTLGLPRKGFMDLGIVAKAKGSGKEVMYLEEAAGQLALLDKWMTTKALIAMLDHIEDVKADQGKLLQAYLAGDDATIVAMANDKSQLAMMGYTEAEFRTMMHEMLGQRNQVWVKTLTAKAGPTPLFVAVGALHLLGDESVNALLTQAGWTVERMP